jgi:predicted dehydrogenase
MAETAPPRLTFAVIGIDHRHIYEMTGRLLELGHHCAGYWTEGNPLPLAGFIKRFPHIPRVTERDRLLGDPRVSLILTAAIPAERAAIALAAMAAGKDVATDKPGCTSLAQLTALRAAVAQTGRIWSVNYSERFESAAATRALQLVRAGAIGRVVQTLGLGPHRLNRDLRPDWFFDPARSGGILCDIGCHQIEQFLTFTGATNASIRFAARGNFANPSDRAFDDFGEMVLQGPEARGYARVDWFTPDGLPTWGDGRFFLLGTEGSMELRKYVDLAGRPGGEHLFLVDGRSTRHIDCKDAGLPYYAALVADVRDRTETAMRQEHCFTVMELALKAEAMAERVSAPSA